MPKSFANLVKVGRPKEGVETRTIAFVAYPGLTPLDLIAPITYWYHPHPHGRTAIQTYSGLSGLYLVEDEDERKLTEALDLRFGETDIPLLIQDKVLDESGNVVYVPGVMQKVILINLTPSPYLEVSTRIYRFRVLNGSNARTYRLAFTMVAKTNCYPFRSSARTAASWRGHKKSVKCSSPPPSGWM